MEQWTRGRDGGFYRGSKNSRSYPWVARRQILSLFNTWLKIEPLIFKNEIEVAHRLPWGGAVTKQDGAVADENNDENAALQPATVIVKFVNRRTNEVVMGKSWPKITKKLIDYPFIFQMIGLLYGANLLIIPDSLNERTKMLMHGWSIQKLWLKTCEQNSKC